MKNNHVIKSLKEINETSKCSPQRERQFSDCLHALRGFSFSPEEKILCDAAYRQNYYWAKKEGRMGIWRSLLFWFAWRFLPCLLLSVLLIQGSAYAQLAPAKTEQLVRAIYLAEGGKKAQYPYGIRSVKCEGKDECYRVCKNTVRNNVKRFVKKHGYFDFEEYLLFLASRYAPIGSGNDPKKLNRNWIRNVRYFLTEGK